MPLASPNDQTLFLDLLFLPLASAQLGRGQTTPRYHTRQFGCDGVRQRAATTHWGGARRLAALRRTRGSSLARARKGGGRASGHRLRGGKRGVVEDEAANYAWGGGHQPAVRKEELVRRPPAGRISSACQARGGALQHGGHTQGNSSIFHIGPARARRGGGWAPGHCPRGGRRWSWRTRQRPHRQTPPRRQQRRSARRGGVTLVLHPAAASVDAGQCYAP
uniref:Uncharacterized protein n=1 Tax=Oryza glaberrima TaxID=4538 RepID=I1QE93_ORYGL